MDIKLAPKPSVANWNIAILLFLAVLVGVTISQYLTVADSGPGFSNLDNALTPLFTTKTTGAGIGLAFVEAVMNKHGGRVKLANQNGAGAKVKLSWPLHAA